VSRATPLVLGLLALTRVGATQVVVNRSATYLFPTDVRDARALWLNPAGPAVTRSASVYADVTAVHPSGGATRFGQVTAGFGSRGLSFGYQYDDFDTGIGHTYRIGAAGASGPLAAGFVAAWYRGGTNAWGYDLGFAYAAGRTLTLGATAANIGQPVVRGVKLDFAMVPGLTLTPLGPRLAMSALGRFGGESEGYALGVRWNPPWSLQGTLLARMDTDQDLVTRGFAFGFAIGGHDQVGVVATTPRDVSRVDASSLYGVAIRQFAH